MSEIVINRHTVWHVQLSRQIAALSRQLSDFQNMSAPKSTPLDEKTYLARREAAAALSISLSTLDQLIVRGKLRVRRIGKRLLVPRKELERLRDVPELVWPAAKKERKP